MGVALSFLPARGGQALTYTSGDLVAVFVNNGNEVIADLGSLASLTSGTSVIFHTQSTLGANGGNGGIFTAFETNSPFNGVKPTTIVFTTDPGLSPLPPSYDNNAIVTSPTYTAGIGAAQAALDSGSLAGGGWLESLNEIAAGGTGVNFVSTTERSLGLSAAGNANSYSNQIGVGSNTINNTLPFSTAATLSANGKVVDLWSAQTPKLNVSSTTLLGTLTVDGNFAGDGSEVRITFSAVPEPGTLLLVAMGLAGLAWTGKRAASK
jgi:hypothetical protein